jgi:hypothetical protein
MGRVIIEALTQTSAASAKSRDEIQVHSPHGSRCRHMDDPARNGWTIARIILGRGSGRAGYANICQPCPLSHFATSSYPGVCQVLVGAGLFRCSPRPLRKSIVCGGTWDYRRIEGSPRGMVACACGQWQILHLVTSTSHSRHCFGRVPEGHAQMHVCISRFSDTKTVLPPLVAPVLQTSQLHVSHLTMLALLACINAQTVFHQYLSPYAF